MNGNDRRLDGNAMGGILGEIFPLDMTLASTQCASCLRTEPVGGEMVYADAPGMVLRCVHCNNVLIRIVRAERRFWMEMRGVACLLMEERR